MKTHKLVKRIFLVLLLIAAIVALHYYQVPQWLNQNMNLEKINAVRWKLKYILKKYPYFSIFTYLTTYITITTFSLPSPTLLTIVGGFAFGISRGTLYTIIAATIGSTFAFLFVRYIVGDSIQEKYAQKLKIFNTYIQRDGCWYLLILRFIPVVPITLINVLAGMTSISLGTFLWTTFIGVIPGTMIYTIAGQRLSQMHTIYGIVTNKETFIIGLLIAAAAFPLLVKYLYRVYRMIRFRDDTQKK